MKAVLSVVCVLIIVFCSLHVTGEPLRSVHLPTRASVLDTNSTDDLNGTTDANLTENIQKSSGNIKFITNKYRATGSFGVNAAVKIKKLALDEYRDPVNKHPGDKAIVVIDVQQGTTSLTLNLGDLGKPSVRFDTPLGEKHIPVLGIIVADVGLDINSRLEAEVSIIGPATTATRTLDFTDWGSQEVEIQINKSAKFGSNVNVNVEFRYIVSIGASYRVGVWPLDYQKDIFNNDVEHLEGNGQLGQTVHVVEPPLWEKILYLLGDLDGMPCLPWLLVFVILAVIGIIYYRKSKKSEKLRERREREYGTDDVVDTRKKIYKMRVRKSEYETPDD